MERVEDAETFVVLVTPLADRTLNDPVFAFRDTVAPLFFFAIGIDSFRTLFAIPGSNLKYRRC